MTGAKEEEREPCFLCFGRELKPKENKVPHKEVKHEHDRKLVDSRHGDEAGMFHKDCIKRHLKLHYGGIKPCPKCHVRPINTNLESNTAHSAKKRLILRLLLNEGAQKPIARFFALLILWLFVTLGEEGHPRFSFVEVCRLVLINLAFVSYHAFAFESIKKNKEKLSCLEKETKVDKDRLKTYEMCVLSLKITAYHLLGHHNLVVLLLVNLLPWNALIVPTVLVFTVCTNSFCDYLVELTWFNVEFFRERALSKQLGDVSDYRTYYTLKQQADERAKQCHDSTVILYTTLVLSLVLLSETWHLLQFTRLFSNNFAPPLVAN